MRKKECLQRKINLKEVFLARRPGTAEWMTGLFMLLFLVTVLCTQMQVEAYRTAALYLEDALAASNLASAVINLEEYGISHTVEIVDPQTAYQLYCDAVKGNLQLNEQWESGNQTLISGPVTVEAYHIYNVKDEVVTVYKVEATGQVTVETGVLGAVRAPNDVVIEHTSIYSAISFPVKGMFGLTVTANKDKLADVVPKW